MSYFDDLSQGSKYHKADLLSDGNLPISVADVDDDECLRGFQGVIAEAEDEGYEVINKHKYTQRGLPGWPGPVYNMAILFCAARRKAGPQRGALNRHVERVFNPDRKDHH